MPDIHHTRSTAAQGKHLLLSTFATALGLAGFQVIFFPWVWAKDPAFVVMFYSILIFILLFVVWISVCEIRANGLFECHLNESELSCVSPVAGSGENFKIALADIEKIQKDSSGESSSWYIWSKQGQRYWLTGNYGNPVCAIVKELQQRRPEIKILNR